MAQRKCKLHDTPLRYDRIPVRFGMPPGPPDKYFESKEALFPNAKTWEMGGCVMGLESEHSSGVYYCSECRVAEKEWLATTDASDYWRP